MSKIALVVLDTLRKDAFDDWFDWLPGHRFENAYSTSHWTVPAHGSLFTGKQPSEAGTYARSPSLDTDEPVLAERLSKMGYDTYGFSTNGHVASGFDFDRGFDEFEQNWQSVRLSSDRFPWKEQVLESTQPLPLAAMSALVEFVRGDYDTLASIRQPIQYLRYQHEIGNQYEDSGAEWVLSCLRSRSFDDPTFLYINLMESHAPLRPPEEFRSIDYPSDGYTHSTLDKYPTQEDGERSGTLERVQTAYKDSVEYLSHIYRQIYRELSDFQYVLTLSDHGELLGENGLWGHSYGLSPNLTNVPFVLSGPTRQSSALTHTVGLPDVFATVLDIAQTTDGSTTDLPILCDETGTEVYTEYHGITYEERIQALADAGVPEDVVTSLDTPLYGVVDKDGNYWYETDGEIQSSPRTAEAPPALLHEYRERSPEIQKRGAQLNEDIKDRLSDLGYV